MNKLIFIELIYLLTSPSASVASWWTLLPHHLQRALELSIRSKLYHIISVIIFLFHLVLLILLFTIVLSLILEICYFLRSLYFFRFRFRAHAHFIHCVKNYLLVGIIFFIRSWLFSLNWLLAFFTIIRVFFFYVIPVILTFELMVILTVTTWFSFFTYLIRLIFCR